MRLPMFKIGQTVQQRWRRSTVKFRIMLERLHQCDTLCCSASPRTLHPPLTMKLQHCLCALAIALLSACSTTSQRISDQEALFNTYTPTERKLIRMGQIAVGFNPDQVRMALGKPSRESTKVSAAGTEIVWKYRTFKPGFGLGIGASSGGSIGAGVGVQASPERTHLLKRIVFDRQTGKVSAIQSFD